MSLNFDVPNTQDKFHCITSVILNSLYISSRSQTGFFTPKIAERINQRNSGLDLSAGGAKSEEYYSILVYKLSKVFQRYKPSKNLQ